MGKTTKGIMNEPNPDELKACPFCGSTEIEYSSPIMSHPPRLTCNNCYTIVTGAEREHLAHKWNTRTPDLATLQRRAEEAENCMMELQNRVAEIVGHSPALSSPVEGSVLKMKNDLLTAQKQIAEKDASLDHVKRELKSIGSAQYRHSAEVNFRQLFIRVELLNPFVDKALSSTPSSFVHKSEVDKIGADLFPQSERELALEKELNTLKQDLADANERIHRLELDR